jgi:hypothetical protein
VDSVDLLAAVVVSEEVVVGSEEVPPGFNLLSCVISFWKKKQNKILYPG